MEKSSKILYQSYNSPQAIEEPKQENIIWYLAKQELLQSASQARLSYKS